jgi:hypothetical protein
MVRLGSHRRMSDALTRLHCPTYPESPVSGTKRELAKRAFSLSLADALYLRPDALPIVSFDSKLVMTTVIG